MNARLVQSLAILAALALALAGGARLRTVGRWGRATAKTVADDVESLFI